MTRFARYKKSFNKQTMSEEKASGGAEPAVPAKPTKSDKKSKKAADAKAKRPMDSAEAKAKARLHFLTRKERRGEALTADERREVAACKKQMLDAARLSKMRREKKRCLRCRERGHTVAACPHAEQTQEPTDITVPEEASAVTNPDSTADKSGERPLAEPLSERKRAICYNCGSDAHMLRDCPAGRAATALKFASCYVCSKTGHIARDCPDNPRGIYPNGGGCRFCGSNRHLARDCLRGREIDTAGSGRGEQIVGTAGAGDEDQVHAALRSIEAEREANRARRSAKPAAKVVKF